MRSDEIRETFLAYFERHEHLRRSSASLVPSVHDPSVLLTTAGMQPLRPYFLGQETPPGPRLTTCQRCFRTTDIEEVGNTARHLTFFEMLGNFSFGDYFKHDAVRCGWELSTEGFGFDPDQIWVTVFEGDDELGLGPDTEAIEIWREIGVPEERIVRLPRAENWWQAGPTGPAGPCSEMYLDRGERFGRSEDLPGDDTERFLEYWNHVFMTYELHEDGSLTDLPRGTATLIAEGVVPSNEDRGYILRRIMRRAIQQGRVLGLEPPYLGRFAERVIEDMGGVYPHLVQHRDTILRWVSDEEESFGRTLARGTALLHELVEDAARQGTSWVDAAEAFKLHDTYGFPYDLTRELLAEEGLSVDDAGFEALMEKQRIRARTGAEVTTPDRHTEVISFVSVAPETRFVGYEKLRATTSVAAAADANGAALVKLEESPFYAEGGGQVADSGRIRWDEAEARVVDVYRVGEDQAVKVQGPVPEPGNRVEAEVERATRHATMRNHTATHLLHAALRERLGTHVRQAGSAVRPDKLRFDFTHGAPLSNEEVVEIGDRVNEWIKESHPVRALQMSRSEAERLGAMALFGEKYGDWVRVIEVEGVSRELCGGTHVANTAEIGVFKLASEGSSAANVRRIEALTGPAAIDWYRERSAQLEQAAALLGSPRDALAGAARAGCAISDPSETIARPLDVVEPPEPETVARLAAEEGAELVVVGLPVSLSGDEGSQAQLAREVRNSLAEI